MTLAGWGGHYLQIGTLLLPVIACAAVGAWWAKREASFPSAFVARLATRFAVPALIFHTLATTSLPTRVLLEVALATAAGLALAALLAAALLRLARLPVAPLLPTATFPNTGNLGLPLASLAFGEAGLAVAVSFFAICSVLQHTLGLWWLGRIAKGDAPAAPSAATPLIIMAACAAALISRGLEVPVPRAVLASASLVGSLAVPLMLVSLGHALATVSRHSMGGGMVVGVTRLVAGGLTGLAVTRVLELPPLAAQALQLQLLMPVAVVNYLYAQQFTRHGALSAGAVLASTLAFLLLSPILLAWIGVGS